MRRRIAAAFVLADSARQVAGFYTLSATAIELCDLPESVTRKLPRYPLVPATLLGRLAVDRGAQRQGLGERLLLDALFRVLRSDIASFAIIVDARDEYAAAFYLKYEFIPLDDRRLFLPMSTIAQLTEV